jgi:radical SAM protein with 4Fe4S-binding SPASM domain
MIDGRVEGQFHMERLRLPGAYQLADHERSRVARHLPRCLFLEVTNRCNLACRTCPHTFTAHEPLRTLDWDEFLRVVDQFTELERAVLHGIGEPLLNPNLSRMVAHLKSRDVTVLFNTNGVLLDEATGHALVESGLDELRVSLDAADPDTYTQIRGKPLHDHVTRNLRRFSSLKREMSADLPRVSLWITGIRENIAELPGVVRLAAQLQIPEVYLQRMVFCLDAADPPGLMSQDHSLSPTDLDISSTIAEAEQAAAAGGVALYASGATDPRGSMEALKRQESRPWGGCRRPWTTAYVTVNGNCLPCCMGPFATTDYDSLKMGNLFETSFAEIWNSPMYQKWRDAMVGGEQAPTPCTGCGVHWSL